MKVVSVILLVAIIGLSVYLLIDTAVYIVKKVKAKKKEKESKNNDHAN